MIWSLIVGGILGWLASLITGKDVPGGVIGIIIWYYRFLGWFEITW